MGQWQSVVDDGSAEQAAILETKVKKLFGETDPRGVVVEMLGSKAVITQVIAAGGFGVVLKALYTGVDETTGAKVADKEVALKIGEIWGEIMFYTRKNSMLTAEGAPPNMVKAVAYAKRCKCEVQGVNNTSALVLPLMGCTVESFYVADGKRGLLASSMVRVLIQASKQLEYLHKTVGMVVGDIKGENILLASPTDDKHITLIDMDGSGYTGRFACPEMAGMAENIDTEDIVPGKNGDHGNPRCDFESLLLTVLYLTCPDFLLEPVLDEAFEDMKANPKGARGRRRLRTVVTAYKAIAEDEGLVTVSQNNNMVRMMAVLRAIRETVYELPAGAQPFLFSESKEISREERSSYTVHEGTYAAFRTALADVLMDTFAEEFGLSRADKAKIARYKAELADGRDNLPYSLFYSIH